MDLRTIWWHLREEMMCWLFWFIWDISPMMSVRRPCAYPTKRSGWSFRNPSGRQIMRKRSGALWRVTGWSGTRSIWGRKRSPSRFRRFILRRPHPCIIIKKTASAVWSSLHIIPTKIIICSGKSCRLGKGVQTLYTCPGGIRIFLCSW